MSIAEEESTRKYYLLECPEHGDGLREKLLDAALENRHVIAQREAYVAGRTARVTEAEIEAAANRLYEVTHAPEADPGWYAISKIKRETCREQAAMMLESARKAVSE